MATLIRLNNKVLNADTFQRGELLENGTAKITFTDGSSLVLTDPAEVAAVVSWTTSGAVLDLVRLYQHSLPSTE
jgi:hypothetical protein